jgi:zinc/manganese transport system substrate-binding protein
MKNSFVKNAIKLLLATSLVASNSTSFAAINVLACEPEWAALAKALGGDHVTVSSATTAFQDPHHIQARPRLISKARNADLLICSGAELEIGWLPILIKKSANPKIQTQAIGNIMTTDYVDLLGKLENVSRSMGDVHAQGNPHVHLDPKRMLIIADVVTQRLSRIDTKNAQNYQQNKQIFTTEITSMLERMQPTIESLNNKKWVVHHNNWLYLNDWLNLQQTATLELKPGVPPTTRHLASLVSELKANPVGAIAYGSYQPEKAARWLGKKTNTTVISMPYTVNGWEKTNAISLWYESVLNTLNDALVN